MLAAALVFGVLAQGRAQPVITPPFIAQEALTLPVIAQHGMVVSQEATASRIGVDVLKRGGNAVDAAVAAAFALAVTLPRAGNLGGGGFMLVHQEKERRTIAIDYRETAPAGASADMFLDAKGAADPRKSRDTGLAVGTPGTVAGLALAHARYGSGRFSLAQLIAPAIALAHDGIPVEGDLADSLPGGALRFAPYPAARAIFEHADGTVLARGETLVQRDLAATLGAIATQGAAGFYTGPVAEKLVAGVQAAGGRLTLDDLAAYAAIERPVVHGVYRGHVIASMPPPSSGGVHVIEILNILEGFDIAGLGHNSAAGIHALAEAMKLAYADRSEYLGDPAFVDAPVRGLTSKRYAAHLREGIGAAARPATAIKPGDPLAYESDQTTHFSVVDDEGNAVANTYTLNFSYGLGLVAPGTGVILNNELDDFAAARDAPNAFGLTGGAANAPAPRKRPLSSMSPTMVFAPDGALELVTGTPGGSTIINTVVQIIVDVIDHGMNIAEATAAPRIHHQWSPDVLVMERGVSSDTVRLLQGQGYATRTGRAFGSVQSIMRRDGALFGAADARQRGTGAVGY